MAAVCQLFYITYFNYHCTSEFDINDLILYMGKLRVTDYVRRVGTESRKEGSLGDYLKDITYKAHGNTLLRDTVMVWKEHWS